jgi:hypothetical protein
VKVALQLGAPTEKSLPLKERAGTDPPVATKLTALVDALPAFTANVPKSCMGIAANSGADPKIASKMLACVAVVKFDFTCVAARARQYRQAAQQKPDQPLQSQSLSSNYDEILYSA